MQPSTTIRLFLLLALLALAACAKQGLLIPLENDLPDGITTRTYLSSLHSIPGYTFTLAPEGFAPKPSFTDWTDGDVAAMSKKAEDMDVDVIAFGRVVDVHSTIGFLKRGCARRTDMRFEFFTIIWPGRHPTLERVLKDYMRDATYR